MQAIIHAADIQDRDGGVLELWPKLGDGGLREAAYRGG
jgi:hypothetical protein